MGNLSPVLESIATSGHAQTILSDVDAVKAFAYHQGTPLADHEAEYLLAIGRHWLADPAQWPALRHEAFAALSLVDGSYSVALRCAPTLSFSERQQLEAHFCEFIEMILGGRHGVVDAFEECARASEQDARYKPASVLRWENAVTGASRLAFYYCRVAPGSSFFEVTIDHGDVPPQQTEVTFRE